MRPANLRAELDVGSAVTAPAAAIASTSRRPLTEGTTTSSSINGGGDQSHAGGATTLLLEPIVNQLTTRIARALAGSDVGFGGSGGGGLISPALIRQIVVDDGMLHASIFPAVWRRLESVEVSLCPLGVYCSYVDDNVNHI